MAAKSFLDAACLQSATVDGDWSKVLVNVVIDEKQQVLETGQKCLGTRTGFMAVFRADYR